MSSREQIINEMCFTKRHDFGIVKDKQSPAWECGLTIEERDFLWREMAQLFDNCILPHMAYKTQ